MVVVVATIYVHISSTISPKYHGEKGTIIEIPYHRLNYCSADSKKYSFSIKSIKFKHNILYLKHIFDDALHLLYYILFQLPWQATPL